MEIRKMKLKPVFLAGLAVLALSACNSTPPTMKLANVLQSGELKFSMKINQPLIINDENSTEKTLKVALGRLDFKMAVIEMHANQQQHSVAFTSAGSYQLTVTEVVASAAPNQFQQSLTVDVN